MLKIKAMLSFWKALAAMLAATAAATIILMASPAHAIADDEGSSGQNNPTPSSGMVQTADAQDDVVPLPDSGQTPSTPPDTPASAPQSNVAVVTEDNSDKDGNVLEDNIIEPRNKKAVVPEENTPVITAASLDSENEIASKLVQTHEDGTENEIACGENGTYLIADNGTYKLTGTDCSPLSITAQNIQLVLENAVVDARGKSTSAISLSNDTFAKIIAIGNNVLIGDEFYAGIYVPADAELVVEGVDNESSYLAVVGNGGIDYSNTTEAANANWSSGCGIGGNGWTGKEQNSSNTPCPNSAAGKISIDGHGNNLTVSAVAGGRGASGIGGGYGAVGSDISILNTNLVNVSGGCRNAEPETNNNKPEYAKQTLEGGAAIGSGTKGTRGGEVILDGVMGHNILGGGKSAAIGGGCWADDVSVIIRNSTLDGVVGGTTGAGIGTGRAQSNKHISILIEDSTIEVAGGYFGAGIGLGINGSNYDLELADIVISHSNITAYGGAGAAGIGGGVRGYNVNVSILDNSNIEAYAGANYQGKYTEKSNASNDTITENGTIGQAGAAAIGRGAWGSVNFNTGKGDYSEVVQNPTLIVSADSNVLAYANGDNWAIAGFTNTDGVDLPILMLRFTRNYDVGSIDHDTRTPDEVEGLDWEALFVDGQAETVLAIKDATTLEKIAELVLPAADGNFANGYTGDGRIGYHTVAIVLPEGAYKLSTNSNLRSLTRLGDTIVTLQDENYLGGATYFTDEGMTQRTDVFVVGNKGFSAYDRVAFRMAAEPEPEPVAPEVPDTPDIPDSPVVPGGIEEPEVPETPVPPVLPVTPNTPEPAIDVPAVSIPTVPVTTPSVPVNAVATPTPQEFISMVNLLAENGDVPEVIQETIAQPAPVEEEILDSETPLSTFDGGEGDIDCWVHWYILLGIIFTSIYSASVIARRKRFSDKLDDIDDDIMGSNDEELQKTENPVFVGKFPVTQGA